MHQEAPGLLVEQPVEVTRKVGQFSVGGNPWVGIRSFKSPFIIAITRGVNGVDAGLRMSG